MANESDGLFLEVWEKHLAEKTAQIYDPFSVILGQSKAIRTAVNYAKLVAVKDTTVLLRGESGTGKELFARAIHNASYRRTGPFIPVNCGNFPQELLESELFGYEKGAFTGANYTGKPGLFEAANQGTIFLDEIADLPLHLQGKLLRVLQEKKIRKLGGVTENTIDVRLILATNRKLEEMVQKKVFREDLYYRINVFPIDIPALRDRKEDIKILAKKFLEKFNARMGKNIQEFSPQAYEKLYKYAWPGNVRELQNVIERTVILSQSRVVKPEEIEIRDFFEGFSDFGRDTILRRNTLKEMLEKIELEIIEESYRKYGSARKVAKDLGLSHTSVINKLKKSRLK
jgi:transcriptional regulator of aroF, aroG, tyrA and aromatic amino acid transport